MPITLAFFNWSHSLLFKSRILLRGFVGSSDGSKPVAQRKIVVQNNSRRKESSNIERIHSPSPLGKIQIEMRPKSILLHFDAHVSLSVLLEDLQRVSSALKEQIGPKARSLFVVRLCFGSRMLHPSFLRLVRTYIQNETKLQVRGLSCSKEAMKNLLSASTGLDVQETSGKSLIVHQTFRSGMMYSVEGELLIYGDVHEGAHVQATGSITVMGVLDGMAHAGSSGNRQASIFASSMENPVLWIDSELLSSDQIKHKRGYSVAALSKSQKTTAKLTMGEL
jgi:septum site-determining protein MinC